MPLGTSRGFESSFHPLMVGTYIERHVHYLHPPSRIATRHRGAFRSMKRTLARSGGYQTERCRQRSASKWARDPTTDTASPRFTCIRGARPNTLCLLLLLLFVQFHLSRTNPFNGQCLEPRPGCEKHSGTLINSASSLKFPRFPPDFNIVFR